MPSRRTLERLLDQRNEHPEKLLAIDAQIRATFERTLAILVLDMCGFSRLTQKHGIIHYLSLIRRMQKVVLPAVAAHGGQLMKTEADNVFATFEDVPAAYATARQVMDELAAMNASLPEDWDVHVGIGIGYGPLLMVGQHDAFGGEMNVASKLGEDIAEAGDVLLSQDAHARMGSKKRGFTQHKKRISGLSLTYYSGNKRRPSKR